MAPYYSHKAVKAVLTCSLQVELALLPFPERTSKDILSVPSPRVLIIKEDITKEDRLCRKSPTHEA